MKILISILKYGKIARLLLRLSLIISVITAKSFKSAQIVQLIIFDRSPYIRGLLLGGVTTAFLVLIAIALDAISRTTELVEKVTTSRFWT